MVEDHGAVALSASSPKSLFNPFPDGLDWRKGLRRRLLPMISRSHFRTPEPEAAGVHKLISDWEPLKSVA